MGIKLQWTGLVFLLALNPLLKLIGLTGSDVLPAVGAVLMVIGNVMMWMDR